jgi:biopolymer transport protein ExbD
MAGSQDPSDNPVAINVVPLVDIIFCLCVFFMCSFKFKQVEGKFDTWLPRDHGPGDPPAVLPSEVRVALLWNEAKREVSRQLGVRRYDDDADLQRAIGDAHQAWVTLGRPDVPVTIDADTRIPWDHVAHVVNLVKRANVDRIEFAMGARPVASAVPR